MICSNCKREIPEGSCFCGLCGHAAEQKSPGMRTSGFVSARTVGEEPMPITRGGGYESGELPEPEVRFSPGFGNNAQPAPKQAAPKAEFRCAACGAVLREGLKFCPVCGAAALQPPVVRLPEQTSPAPEALPAEPEALEPEQDEGVPCAVCGVLLRQEVRFCNHCGASRSATIPAPQRCCHCQAELEAEAKFCNRCGAQQEATPEEQPEEAPAPKKKSKKLPVILIGVVVLLLTGLIVAGALTEWFGLFGPLTRIGLAGGSVVGEGNFTADFFAEADGMAAQGTMVCDYDLEQEQLTVQMLLDMDGKTAMVALYEKHVIARDFNGREYVVDISASVDAFFDSLEEKTDINEALEQMLNKAFLSAGLEGQVDVKEARRCVLRSLTTINTTRWLTENAGMTEARVEDVERYTFAPEMGALLLACMERLESAFVHSEDFNALMAQLEKDEETISRETQMQLSFGLADGKLVQLELQLQQPERTMKVQLELSRIGKTRVDTQTLQAMLDKYK